MTFQTILAGLAVVAKSFHHEESLEQATTSSFDTLFKLGEKPPRDKGDASLHVDIYKMNMRLGLYSDDSILNMERTREKKIVITLSLYANLGHVLSAVKPTLIGDISLRMVDLSLSNGLVPSSPFGFAYYGGVLLANGSVKEGCRLGKYLAGCLFPLK